MSNATHDKSTAKRPWVPTIPAHSKEHTDVWNAIHAYAQASYTGNERAPSVARQKAVLKVNEAVQAIVEYVSRLVREDERRECIAYADRTERMYLARAQAIADDTDRADGNAAADDEERAAGAAAGARAVAHGLRKGAHR